MGDNNNWNNRQKSGSGQGNRNGHRNENFNRQNGGGNRNFQRNTTPSRSVASAPYNFIPLPRTALPAPLVTETGTDWTEQYVAYVQKEGTLSGVIELDIETKTPFFIGSEQSEQFFSPLGDEKYVVPGSSLRGMVKNIMKILTCGAMRPAMRQDIDVKEIEGDGDFHDRKLYYRTFAAKKEIGIKAEYDDELVTNGENGLGKSKATAGFLLRIGKQYYICPTESQEIKNEALVSKFSPKNTPRAAGQKSCIKWEWDRNGKKVVACFTGDMRNKKRYTVHQKPADWNHLLEVPNHAVIDYQDDSTRRGINLFLVGKSGSEAAEFTQRSDVSYVVPCFYVAKKEKVRHFGFGRYYRIPYKYGISEHVPSLLQTDTPDFTDALFGRKEAWGSRLFFENCVPAKDAAVRTLAAAKTRILSTPNPTSFQLYLEQNQQNPRGNRCHWNSRGEEGSPVPIRGYKHYWHQDLGENGWKRRPNEKDLEGTTPIMPIAAGTKFHGKIRFERLSEIELGALAKVFYMAEKEKSMYFKLGRGKSIGMGSVRIDAKLKLIDKSSYTQLFDDNTWHTGETAVELKTYADVFDAHVREKLNADPDKTAYDRYQRSLLTLGKMLNWQTTKLPNWKAETEMMTIGGRDNPFTNRVILPDVDGVIARAKTGAAQ